MHHIGSIILGLALFAISIGAGAQNLLYANNAGFNDRIDVISRDTGALIRSCFPNKPSGRGLVVIGNIAYHTVATANNIYKMDMNTCADLGIAFTVAGATAVSSIRIRRHQLLDLRLRGGQQQALPLHADRRAAQDDDAGELCPRLRRARVLQREAHPAEVAVEQAVVAEEAAVRSRFR